ncbi:MAG TPA: hypothetical protein VEU31_05655 [Candidatus Acidoferrales bacterium]|nr:hypothetical protein [Candidatus Acidoferrales bacterium]
MKVVAAEAAVVVAVTAAEAVVAAAVTVVAEAAAVGAAVVAVADTAAAAIATASFLLQIDFSTSRAVGLAAGYCVSQQATAHWTCANEVKKTR